MKLGTGDPIELRAADVEFLGEVGVDLEIYGALAVGKTRAGSGVRVPRTTVGLFCVVSLLEITTVG